MIDTATSAEALRVSTNSPLFDELLEKLETSLKILPGKPEETPARCLIALWHKAAGVALSALSAEDRPIGPLGPVGEKVLRALVDARLAGTPLAYLTERQQFMGIDFISNPSAVIPRKDTEPLATAVMNCIRTSSGAGYPLVVVDMFTGSGNIPLTLAKLTPGQRYYGSDLSPDAIRLARQNAEFLGLSTACHFLCGDMFAPFENDGFYENVDIISGAPPCISSAKVPTMPAEISRHEPPLALDAGPFGLSLILRLIADSPRFLKRGGWLFFEVGLGQGPGVFHRVSADGRFENVQTLTDHKGDIRVVAGQKK
jgi:release factor glutamine methyltransferase